MACKLQKGREKKKGIRHLLKFTLTAKHDMRCRDDDDGEFGRPLSGVGRGWLALKLRRRGLGGRLATSPTKEEEDGMDGGEGQTGRGGWMGHGTRGPFSVG